MSVATTAKPALAELSARLGHEFADPAHLKLALTHASARAGAKPNEDNERLEFLGDRVLGLAVAGTPSRWLVSAVAAALVIGLVRLLGGLRSPLRSA